MPKIALLFGELLVRGQIEAFQGLKDRFQITLFVWARNNVPLDEINLQQETVKAITHYLPDNGRIGRFINRQITNAHGGSLVPFLEQRLRQFDIIFSGEPYTSWTRQALGARKLSGAKVVVQSYENLPFRRESTQIIRQTKELSYRNADHFIATTNQSKEVLIAEGAPRGLISLIPPAVNTSFFIPSERQKDLQDLLGCTDSDFTVLFAGRMLWSKGILDLVEAASIFAKNVPIGTKFKFVLVGTGPERDLVGKYIQYFGVQEHVSLVDRVPHQRMPAIYSQADVFVAPSSISPEWEEQFGVVLTESMSCARAVVSTNTGAIPEVTQGYAMLVPCRNPLALAHALLDLWKNPAERAQMGLKAREFVEREYAIPVVARRLDEVFTSLLKDSTSVSETVG